MSDTNAIVKQAQQTVKEFHTLSEKVTQESNSYKAHLEVFKEQFESYCDQHDIDASQFNTLEEIQQFLAKKSTELEESVVNTTQVSQQILEAANNKDWFKVAELLDVKLEVADTTEDTEVEAVEETASEPAEEPAASEDTVDETPAEEPAEGLTAVPVEESEGEAPSLVAVDDSLFDGVAGAADVPEKSADVPEKSTDAIASFFASQDTESEEPKEEVKPKAAPTPSKLSNLQW